MLKSQLSNTNSNFKSENKPKSVTAKYCHSLGNINMGATLNFGTF